MAQQTTDNGRSETSAEQKNEDPYFLRWKIYLDSVAEESRTVFPEERRAYAIVGSANAYWDIDSETSRALFISALNTALSVTKQDKKYRPLINYVLSSATKRDPALAKILSKRLIEEGFDDANDVSGETALDLVEENPEAAARLAEALAPNGLRYGTALDLIFRLAAKDTRLSDHVYGVYLNRVSADQTIPLDLVLFLSGYSFGYAEYYSIDGRGNISGATLRPNRNLSANRFANSFLNLAFRRIAVSIERRNRAIGEDITALNFPILFGLEYLMPEVARFSPNTLSAWQQLQQQGMVGTTPAQVQQVRNYIQQINQARVRAQNFNDSSQTPEQEAEASLEDVEKIPGTCQRDVIRSEAALLFSSRKNFKRASEIAATIEDLKQNESVEEVIRINLAEEAIGKDEIDDTVKKIDEVASLEHRTILYANFAAAKKDQHLIDKAVMLAEKLPNAGDRTGILFSLSTILLKSDPLRSQMIFGNAIKNLNDVEPADRMSFSVPLKVTLSCRGEDKWYGGFETLPNSTIFDAVSIFAQQDPDAASRLADEIEDKITKLRSQAIIAKLALANRPHLQ